MSARRVFVGSVDARHPLDAGMLRFIVVRESTRYFRELLRGVPTSVIVGVRSERDTAQ